MIQLHSARLLSSPVFGEVIFAPVSGLLAAAFTVSFTVALPSSKFTFTSWSPTESVPRYSGLTDSFRLPAAVV